MGPILTVILTFAAAQDSDHKGNRAAGDLFDGTGRAIPADRSLASNAFSSSTAASAPTCMPSK